jgi:hypothetical protein
MANEAGHFRLECVTDGAGGQLWSWTLTDELGLVIATSARFPDRKAALQAAEWVTTRAAACAIEEPPSDWT